MAVPSRCNPQFPEDRAPCGEAIAGSMPRRGHQGLCLLLEASLYAAELHRGVWDFAVEIGTLRQAGCTNGEFRWLVCKDYVDHALENTVPGAPARTFQRLPGACRLTFSHRTCFVLTESGFDFARSVLEGRQAEPTVRGGGEPQPSPPEPPAERKPSWDRARQELRLGEVVVKQFKVPAANQERILAAFEEDGWPVRIDDPLPPNSDQDPKRRLHDTINSLNRNQKRNLIRFTGDGSGEGVLWQLTGQAG